MAQSLKKLIIFDIDGTLLLSGGAGAAAFNHTFRQLYRIENAWQDIHPDGRTDPSLIEELFHKNLGRPPSLQEISEVGKTYAVAMEAALPQSKNFRLMPGALTLLENILSRQLGHLGLATGNFETTAQQKLKHAGMKDFFSYGGFGSDHADRFKLTQLAVERGLRLANQEISPKNVILVGDSEADVDCGRRLGVKTVAVATGSTSLEKLAKGGPDILLESFTPLEKVISIFE